MSTPLESNTEGLLEVLDAVSNLPDRSTGTTSLPVAMYAMDAGTYTPDVDVTKDVFITHNLGVIPDFTFFFVPDEVSNDTYPNCLVYQVVIVQPYSTATGKYSAYRNGKYYNGTSEDIYNISGNISDVYFSDYLTEDKFTVCANKSYKLKAGVTYNWLACKFT